MAPRRPDSFQLGMRCNWMIKSIPRQLSTHLWDSVISTRHNRGAIRRKTTKVKFCEGVTDDLGTPRWFQREQEVHTVLFFIFFYCFFWAAAFPLWPLDMPTITESLIRAAGSSWGNRTKTHKCDPITLVPEIIPTLRFSGTYSRPDSLSFLFFFSPPRADNTPDDNQPSWRPSYLFIIN